MSSLMKHATALTVLAAAFALSLAGCGGRGESATGPAPSQHASSSSAPSAVHSAKPGEPGMITAPGYTYVNPSSEFASDVQKTLRANRDAFKSASAHGVVHEGTWVAAIALFPLLPEFADNPGFAQGALEGWSRDMAGPGVRVSMKTIHSERVAVAEAASGAAGYGWCHNGVLTELAGPNGAEVRDYVDAYLQAAHE
jgi:hypothetical protein